MGMKFRGSAEGRGSLSLEEPVTSFFAPAVRQLLCAWRTRPEALEESLVAAVEWLSAARDSLHWLKPLILWSQESEETFRQAELDLKEFQRLLDDPKLRAKADAPDTLQTILERYYSNLFRLQAVEEKHPAYSPILAVDQVIRVAFNFLQGKCEALDLQARFGPLRGAVAEAGAGLEFRARLFSEQTWPEALFVALQQMQGGVGALAQFLETGEPRLLEHSIQLLGKGSSDFANELKSPMDAALSQPKFSPHDDLECWLRLQAYPFDLGPELGQHLWERLYARVDSFFRALQLHKFSGLGISQPQALQNAALIHQQALDRLSEVSQAPLDPEAQAQLLVPLWAEMSALESGLRESQLALQGSLQGSPAMLELLEILGQVESGLLPTWVLRYELEKRLEQQQASLEALQSACESGAIPSQGESMLQLLASHTPALQRMLIYCEDQQSEHLVEGWSLIALTLPSLFQFDQDLRRSVSEKGRSGQQVTCIRCGEVQPPARVCRACSAALPQMQLDEVRYEDISGVDGRSQAETPSEYLAELVSSIPFGGSSWEDVRLEVVGQLKGVEETRERFERELLSMMGKNEMLDLYCQFFVVKLGQMSQALTSLGELVMQRNQNAVQASLGGYQQLQDELQEFQKRIDEGLKKTPR